VSHCSGRPPQRLVQDFDGPRREIQYEAMVCKPGTVRGLSRRLGIGGKSPPKNPASGAGPV